MVSWLAAGSNCMISILLSSRWLGFHKGLKVAAYRTRFETQERAQREIFCCIETYGRTSEPNGAKISIAFVEDGGELHAFYDGVLSGMDKPWGGVSWLLARNG